MPRFEERRSSIKGPMAVVLMVALRGAGLLPAPYPALSISLRRPQREDSDYAVLLRPVSLPGTRSDGRIASGACPPNSAGADDRCPSFYEAGPNRATYSILRAGFDFIEARYGKAGVRQLLLVLRNTSNNLSEDAFYLTRDQFDRAFEEYLLQWVTSRN
jgi:hypothetical protein